MVLPKGKEPINVLILTFTPNFNSTPGLQLLLPSCNFCVIFRHKNAVGIVITTSAMFTNYYARIVC